MADPNIEWGFPLHGSEPNFSVLNAFAEIGEERYNLVVNLEWTAWAKCFAATIASLNTYVCGPCLGSDSRSDMPFEDDLQGKLWQDQEWISANLPLRYPFLHSGFIGEIFCRLAYLTGKVPRYEVPREDVTQEVPDVIISGAASLPEKLWTLDKWLDLIGRCKKEGLSVGLVGARPTAQSLFWKGSSDEEQLVERRLVKDLRGTFRLPEVVGALAKTKAVVTIDNGILHLAVAGGKPVIGLYRYGIHRLWAPPHENLTVLTPGENAAVAEIDVDVVWEALTRAL
jgi:heptosyltransferase-3